MNPDGFEAIAMVRVYLRDRVLPVVPPEISGELKAAIKLLETAVPELLALHSQLTEESAQLLALCTAVVANLRVDSEQIALVSLLHSLTTRFKVDVNDTAALRDIHRRVCEVASTLITRLFPDASRDVNAARHLRELIAALGRHAATRIPWQSVFPVPANPLR